MSMIPDPCGRTSCLHIRAERDALKARVDSAESSSRGHAFAFDQACQRAEAAEARGKELELKLNNRINRVEELEANAQNLRSMMNAAASVAIDFRTERDDARAQVEAMRAWVIDVRDEVLSPLATQDNDLGRVAEGFGQSTVKLLAALSASVPAQEPKHIEHAFGRDCAIFGWCRRAWELNPLSKSTARDLKRALKALDSDARLRAEVKRLRKENERFRDTILWADGLRGEFRPQKEGEGKYWWRTEMMERANPILEPYALKPVRKVKP